MIVRDELREAVEQIADAGEGWRRAYKDWQVAVRERERLSERMDHRVSKAAGGLSVARFEATCRRRYFHDVEDARRKAAAIRARPAVEAAVAERDRVLAAADVKVLAARVSLRPPVVALGQAPEQDILGRTARRRLAQVCKFGADAESPLNAIGVIPFALSCRFMSPDTLSPGSASCTP